MDKTLRKKLLFIFLVFHFVSFGQQKKTALTLEDIYVNQTYRQKNIGTVRWMKDNQGYSALESDENSGGNNIVRYEAQSGKKIVLVSTKQLIPPGQSKPLIIANYEWSADDSKILLFTNTKKGMAISYQGRLLGTRS